MKSIIYGLSALVLTAALGGCATVTRGTTEEYKVTSTPPGAAVKTSTGFTCSATPCSMKMPRKEEFDVTLTKAGYTAKTLHVRSVVSGGGAAGMAGNILAGGIIGMAVDGTSGAMNDLTPNPMDVTLAAEVEAVPAAAPAAVAAADPVAKPAADPAPAAAPVSPAPAASKP